MARASIPDIRRREILEAALKVVSENGYQNTTIADIAAELEMGHGTIYRYFRNKQDIAAAVLDEVISRITKVVLDIPAKEIHTLEEYRQRLYLIGEGLVGAMQDDPMLARWISYETLGIPPEINAKIESALSLFANYTESYLKNGVEKGFLRPDIHTWETALAINAMLFEAAKRLSRAAQPIDEAKKKWFETVIGLMLEGLAAGAGEGGTKGRERNGTG